GGWALAVHGAPRATTDLDLLVTEDDLARAIDAVRPLGFRHPAAPMCFPDGMRIQRITKIEGHEALTLDLLLVTEALEEVWAEREQVRELGGTRWVTGRAGLIRMKLWAGRTQALADVARLREDDR